MCIFVIKENFNNLFVLLLFSLTKGNFFYLSLSLTKREIFNVKP